MGAITADGRRGELKQTQKSTEQLDPTNPNQRRLLENPVMTLVRIENPQVLHGNQQVDKGAQLTFCLISSKKSVSQ